MGITAWDTAQLSTAIRGTTMTEQTGQTTPPEWWSKPPEWMTRAPASAPPAGRPASYDAGRQDQELLTAIRAMPEQVVSSLREAIQGAQQPPAQQPPAQQPPAQQPPAQQGDQSGGNAAAEKDNGPKPQKTFAERWFDNSL